MCNCELSIGKCCVALLCVTCVKQLLGCCNCSCACISCTMAALCTILEYRRRTESTAELLIATKNGHLSILPSYRSGGGSNTDVTHKLPDVLLSWTTTHCEFIRDSRALAASVFSMLANFSIHNMLRFKWRHKLVTLLSFF